MVMWICGQSLGICGKCRWGGLWTLFFFFQAEDGIRDLYVTGVQTCALPIYLNAIEDYQPMGLPTGAAAILLAAVDTGPQATADLAAIASACRLAQALEVYTATEDRKSACRERV